MVISVKEKTCKVCRAKFISLKPLQAVCGLRCAQSYAWRVKTKTEVDQAKAERKEIRAKRESIKTRSQWIKEAQIAFNSYIRERDKDKPCISCGVPLEKGQIGGGFDCGHFRSVGSAPHLRFGNHAELNAHGQCKRCNRYLSGNAIDYRIRLVGRIGVSSVERLEADNEPRKWSIDELKEIISTYRKKTRELKNANE